MPRRRTPKLGALAIRRHGLYSQQLVTPFEAQLEWEEFCGDVIDAFNPVGAVEFGLAERSAELLWRLRRAALDERYFVDKELERQIGMAERQAHYEVTLGDAIGPDSETRQPVVIEKMPTHVALPERGRASIIKFEAHLNRQLMHALHELEALQERRQGKPMPLARVDVHGLPGT